MSVLVTGASGFVGSAVTRALLAQGQKIRVLLRPASDRRNINGLNVETVTGDLRQPESLAAALNGCRFVYHVAADYRLWTPRPADLYETNVAGTNNLIRAAVAAGVERIVYTSSVATLGINANREPGDETTPSTLDDMIGHYKRSKFMAEQAVQRLVAEIGAPVVIVNPSTPVGPRDIKPTPTGRMIVEAAAGRMPAYVDTGLNLVHVDDVAAGHLLACRHGVIGERYVLGGENMTLAEILSAIAHIVGRRPPKIRLPHNLVLPLAMLAESWARLFGTGEPFATRDGIRMAKKYMFFLSSKAQRVLGYRARPVDDALQDAVAWFRANGDLAQPRTNGDRTPP
jgi:dihydroflavonol-4-reductase